MVIEFLDFTYFSTVLVLCRNPAIGQKEKVICIILKHWVGQKSLVRFFHKIKDTFFIFTNNCMDLDILSMSAIFCVVYVDYCQLMSWFDCYQPQLVYPTMEHCPARNLQHQTLQTTFDMFDQS